MRQMQIRQDIESLRSFLSPKMQRRLRWMALWQALSSVLDLIGVGLTGAAVVALTAAGSDEAPSGWIERAERFLADRGADDPSATLIVLLASSAGVVLLSKSVLALALTRRLSKMCAAESIDVASSMWRRKLEDPMLLLRKENSMHTAYVLNNALNSAMVVGVMVVIGAIGDLAALTLLGIALFVVSFPTTLALLVFFGLIVLAQQRILSKSTVTATQTMVRNTVSANMFVQDALGVYCEIASSGSLERTERDYRHFKSQVSNAHARLVFFQTFPRYAAELALVIGGALVLIVQLSYRSLEESAGVLAFYFLSASRILPALLRLQNGALAFRYAITDAEGAIQLKAELDSLTPRPTSAIDLADRDTDQALVIDALTFQYPDGGFHLTGLSATVRPGQTLALVGRSGSGKSTYANLVVGLLPPSSGSVTYGGAPTFELLGSGKLRVGYVPQECYIIDATLRANVTVGCPTEVTDAVVEKALRRAHLGDLLDQLPLGLDAPLGERGAGLSGGQRQRVALARALCAEVDLLVLDEATSALDAETEAAISDVIAEINQSAVLVVIAHRLSTVRNADVLAYLEDGRVRAVGTFEEVSAQVPEFARQADLLGLLS